MSSAEQSTIRRPFIEHIRELQLRLTWSAIAIGLCGLAAYPLYPRLLDLIQRPLGQTLYYTSPTGGFNFIFKICFVTGLVVALPFLLYQIFCFVGPLLKRGSKLSIIKYVFWAFFLAVAGVLFGYFISLPAALRFLTSIGGDNIESLIRADEYFNFALTYIAGFALIFQVPLIMLFINRIKPLPPRQMMKFQRYIVLASFIISAVLTPTPDPVNQAIMALPMVFLYQVGIALVWLVNKKRNRTERKLSKLTVQSTETMAGVMALANELPSITLSSRTMNQNTLPIPQASVQSKKRHISEIPTSAKRKNYMDIVRERSSSVISSPQVQASPKVNQGRLIDMVLN